MLAYTDEFVKKIYFDLCRYYISGKDQNSTEIYSSKRADILRALKILEKLGLVRTQTTNDQFIYSHYVPRYYFEGKIKQREMKLVYGIRLCVFIPVILSDPLKKKIKI